MILICGHCRSLSVIVVTFFPTDVKIQSRSIHSTANVTGADVSKDWLKIWVVEDVSII